MSGYPSIYSHLSQRRGRQSQHSVGHMDVRMFLSLSFLPFFFFQTFCLSLCSSPYRKFKHTLVPNTPPFLTSPHLTLTLQHTLIPNTPPFPYLSTLNTNPPAHTRPQHPTIPYLSTR